MPVLKAEGRTFSDPNAGADHRRRRVRHDRGARRQRARRGSADPRARCEADRQYLALRRPDPGRGHEAAARRRAARRHARDPRQRHHRQGARRVRPRDRLAHRARVGEDGRLAGRSLQAAAVVHSRFPVSRPQPACTCTPRRRASARSCSRRCSPRSRRRASRSPPPPTPPTSTPTPTAASAACASRGPDGKTEDIGCDALILACCGYGGDKAMIAKYIPEMVNAHYHGHAGNTGDAVKWGEALGASIKDMGSFQGHGAVATPHNTHIGWPAITEGGYPGQQARQALLERERGLFGAGAQGRAPARPRRLG